MIGSRAGGTALRRGSCQPPIRSPFARRRCLWWVADPRATDPHEGTKPVYERVNTGAATTGLIIAVYELVAAHWGSVTAV